MTKRILHIVGGMNRGGVETWLMHVLRHIDREQYRMDFLVHTTQPCAYDDEIRSLGSRIIPCLHPSKPLTYARNFKRILREYGPYDVVHSHVHHFSGYVLRLAAQMGIPIRIAHSHSDTKAAYAKANLPRQIYLRLTEYWVRQYATHGLGVSEQAAVALFGPHWRNDRRWSILLYGIDLRPFAAEEDRITVRAEFGILSNAHVIGHVGRFVDVKNHTFLIDVVAEAVKLDPDTVCLLIGDGPLRPEIQQKVQDCGLSRHVVFAGLRADIPRVMKAAMDCFVFPSHYEGLGIVLIEAQAAGLPCIYSDVIPKEVIIVPELMHAASLDSPAADWVKVIQHIRQTKSNLPQAQALHRVMQSPFGIQVSAQGLKVVYRGN